MPFTSFKTSQTTIAAIEKLTQLKFTGTKGTSRMSLSVFDSLKKRQTKPRLTDHSARSVAGQEPMIQLTQLDQVVLKA